jgi:hypothetical protein
VLQVEHRTVGGSKRLRGLVSVMLSMLRGMLEIIDSMKGSAVWEIVEGGETV